eukprot:SM000007S20907  [mRNA]  locus=s7:833539:834419:- [translate_table: standard]
MPDTSASSTASPWPRSRATAVRAKAKGRDGRAAADAAAADPSHSLGYGAAGEQARRPWYTLEPPVAATAVPERADVGNGREKEATGSSSARRPAAALSDRKVTRKRKTVDELRAERLQREQRERQRALGVLASTSRATEGGAPASGAASSLSKKQRYNSAFGYGR